MREGFGKKAVERQNEGYIGSPAGGGGGWFTMGFGWGEEEDVLDSVFPCGILGGWSLNA